MGEQMRYYLFDSATQAKLIKDGVLVPFSVSSDRVYCWGRGTDGQLGDGRQNDFAEDGVLVHIPDKSEFLQVASGRCHTVALTSYGELFTWGTDNYGQTGHGVNGLFLRPKQIEDMTYVRVTKVACGDSHTLALSDLGKVYSFGKGDYGQLGNDKYKDRLNPKGISAFDGLEIVDIECGYHHSAVISESGSLYMFGRNDHGELGTGDTQISGHPTLVLALHKNPVRKISCGAYHNAAITDEGFYVWGSGENGRLGIGKTGNKLSPTLIRLDSNVIDISCGYNHTVALTSSGEIYTWGANEHGQLGFPIEGCKQLHKPKKLGFTGIVEQIFAGHCYTVVVTDDGNLYTWGKFGGSRGSTPIQNSTLPLGVKYFGGGINHASAVLGSTNSNSLGALFDSEEFADIRFDFLEISLYAHICILKARCRSSTFMKLLEERVYDEESGISSLMVTEYSYEIFRYFIGYLYEDFIPPISVEESLELRSLALRYQLPRLHTMCEAILFEDADPYVFASSLSRDLTFLYQQKEYTDMSISFTSTNKTLELHKAILYCRSPYFKTMFDMKMSEYEGHMVVAETDFTTFKAIIEDIYLCDTLSISGENVFDVYVASHQYRSTKLMKLSEQFILSHLDQDILVSVLMMADIFESDTLYEAAYEYINRNKECYNILKADPNWEELDNRTQKKVTEMCCRVFQTKNYDVYHEMKEEVKAEKYERHFVDCGDPNYDSEEDYWDDDEYYYDDWE
eukprot:TRINITY_DN3949_c0_g1_i1.p1 TRINITY_DN3949_c0_g1~~TRINITY_DN3949_c0_g1_i1.p1  ORF type:complete len:747 (+),score=161.89 TRINITY_DN3949_c0_g1_i1:30-2243(+)